MKIISYLFSTLFLGIIAMGNEHNELNESLSIITKNIDLSQLQGVFYEVATNMSANVLPGLACRCTSYEFSKVYTDEKTSYFFVNFRCQRNFVFENLETHMKFKLVLLNPLEENKTVVEELTARIFSVKENGEFLLHNGLSLLYAETDEENKIKNAIFAGKSPFEPVFIISRERQITINDYNRLLNSLYIAGYNPQLLSWPFIIQSDQSMCE